MRRLRATRRRSRATGRPRRVRQARRGPRPGALFVCSAAWRRRSGSGRARGRTTPSSKHWYPPGTPPKERLPYYAERFSTVEVDSTYYRVPTEQMVRGWAERTPRRFRHAREGVRADDAASGEARAGAARPPRGHAGRLRAAGSTGRRVRRARARVPRVPRALEPLRDAGKLGGHPVPDAAVRRLEAVVARLPRVGARPGRGRRYSVRAAPPLVVRRGHPRRAAALARGAADDVGRRRRAEDRRGERSRRRSSRRRRRWRTCASTAATPARGTRAAGRPRSASTTSTARTSCASGSGRCASSSNDAEEAYAFFNNNNQTDGVAQAPAGAQLLRKLLDEEHVPTA